MKHLESADFQACRRCQLAKQKLSHEEAKMLKDLDAIRPSFCIWHAGRREDSSQHLKNSTPPVEQPAEVQPGLYLGDLDDAFDLPRLAGLGIGGVLCLCMERLGRERPLLGDRLGNAGIDFQALPAEDNRDFDIVGKTLPRAFDFISTQQRQGCRVLVCCYGGINRSAAVVVGFLALQQGMRLVEAVEMAMQQRGTILTNRAFRLQLVQAFLDTRPPPAPIGKAHSQNTTNDPALPQKRCSSSDEEPELVTGWGFCCKRRAAAGGGSVKWVIGGVGHVVHGLCFEKIDGTRVGVFLADDGSILELQNDCALMRRNAEWKKLDEGEFVTRVSGHESKLPFLAADIVLHTNMNHTLEFGGVDRHFERNALSPFSYQAPPGSEITEAFFDLQGHTCSGIQSAPLSLSRAALQNVATSAGEVSSCSRVRWIIGGVGHVVHGLCFVLADDTRLGIFLNDDRTTVDLRDDHALRRRHAKWQRLAEGEFIVQIIGHGSRRIFLAADVVLRTNRGRDIVFRGGGQHFDENCLEAFRFTARRGCEIFHVLFDRKQSTCIGIKDAPLCA